MADVRRFDPAQKRDPDGKWGDGIPGPSLPDLDMEGFDLISRAEGTFGELEMGVDTAGDVRLAWREGDNSRALDLGPTEVAELGDALDDLAGERDEFGTDGSADDLVDDRWFGTTQEHKAELLGNGVMVITFGAEDPDPWTLTLDPPHEADPGDPGDEDYDDVQAVLDAIDDVLTEVDASRSAGGGELRRFNPNQKRDPNGEWADGVAGPSALKDALKLAGKVNLEPDEKLIGSGKVDGGAGGIRMALTEHNGQRMLRFGAGGENYGKRDREEGTPAWDGNPSRAPLSKAERERLSAEDDALDEEWDGASPARQDEIDRRRDDIREQLAADEQGFNGTAKLDEYGMRRLADKIAPALAEAVEQEKAENKAWDEIEALQAKGNPDPARLAQLQQTARAVPGSPGYDGITFVEGVIPGAEWGDVHYSVELDDVTTGVIVRLGVWPKGATDDWGDGRDWAGQFDTAETRKFLRLLDQYTGTASRSRKPKEALVFERYNDQHAPAGSANGGQFTSGGGGGQDKKPAPPGKRTPNGPRKPRKPAPHGDSGTLSYDPNSNHGTGYDSKTGDPRVHALQQALNRLGIKDSAGKELKDDGRLGPKTTSAVKALQQRLGLKPDGRVTPALLAQIKSMKSLPAQKRSGVMDMCIRAFGFEFEERSRNSDGRMLEGYAAVFNSPTRIAAVGGDFDEVISQGAFTRSLKSRMPVLQFEHGRDPRVGAVPIGSIDDLSEDSQGLHVRATLFDNPVVEPVRQAIAGRAIKGMSFRFNVAANGDTWQRRSGDVDLRTVGDADVHELGPVVFPAYDSTTVSVRSLLAQLGPEEHLTLLRELAHDLRSIEPTGVGPSARSSGGADLDQDESRDEPRLSIRQRLDEGALRSRGILT